MDKYLVIGILIFTVTFSKTYSTPLIVSQDRDVENLLIDRAIGVNLACGKSSSYKNIVMHDTRVFEQTATKCSYTIQPYNSYVCQVRIDINYLHITPPDSVGKCTDKLLIKSLNNFEICGLTVVSHVYVPLNNTRDNVEIELSVGSGKFAIWNLTVTQLQCPTGSPRMLIDEIPHHIDENSMLTRTIFNDGYLIAPNGCLQYYPDPSGFIESFNYNNGAGNYLLNMNYAICFRRRADDTKLTLVGQIEMSVEDPDDTYDEGCFAAVAVADAKEDYLFIPESISDNGERHTRYCGSHSSTTIESSPRGPFVIYFHTDGQHDAEEKGFHLTYSIS